MKIQVTANEWQFPYEMDFNTQYYSSVSDKDGEHAPRYMYLLVWNVEWVATIEAECENNLWLATSKNAMTAVPLETQSCMGYVTKFATKYIGCSCIANIWIHEMICIYVFVHVSHIGIGRAIVIKYCHHWIWNPGVFI